jgi:voltage-gated potassium channel
MYEADHTANWRKKLFTIIFEADTRAGKIFDICLLVLIIFSVCLVLLQSIPAVHAEYRELMNNLEWAITIIFTVEYTLRLLAVRTPLKYAGSFYGVIDLLAILPTYLSLIFPASHYLVVVRSLRLMRVFRILKLAHFVRESNGIVLALKASARRILVFLAFVVLLSVILGSIIYVVENGVNPSFSSIPQSIYWAIVTITTVGYGDISPVTAFGKLIASLIMLLGYSILAVPTGIVTVELSRRAKLEDSNSQACPNCSRYGHDADAKFCKYCGHSL